MPVRVPPRLTVSALVASLALLSGCGAGGGSDTASATGGSTPSGSAAATTTSTAPEEETPAEVAPFDGDTAPDTEAPSDDARLTVSAVRLAAQDGFDRVVFELGGEGTPGWDVRYVDQPTSEGSGDPVAVEGEAFLQVSITGAGYPFDTGVDEYAGGPLTAAGTASVTEVVFDGTYEGVTTAFVGTGAQRPFKAYLLDSPARVVVEVAHAG